MILADVDIAATAITSAISAVAGGVLGRLLAFRKDRVQQDADNDAASDARETKLRKDAYKEASLAYQAHLKSKDEYIAMQSTVIGELERAQEAWREAAADCREDVTEQRTVNFYLFDALKRAFTELRALGRDPGALPDLPPVRPRRDAVADFLSRQASQSAKTVRELDAKLSTPPPVSPSPPT